MGDTFGEGGQNELPVHEVQDTLPLGRITDTFRLIWG